MKDKIKTSFSENAVAYDRHAVVHKKIIDRLVGSLAGDYKNILDLGCGTGTLAAKLVQQYPAAKIIGLDLAPGMIERARAKVISRRVEFVVGDAETLAFGSTAFDLVVSTSSLQWMAAEKVFAEAARVLRPAGQFVFSTFGPATFSEIRKVGLSVNKFIAKGEIERISRHCFHKTELASWIATEYYSDVFDFFRRLRSIGAQIPEKVNEKGLWTKRKIDSLFLNNKGKDFTVSYEVFFGRASNPTLPFSS